MSLPTQAFGVRKHRGNLFFAGKESRWSKFRIDGLKKGWETEPPNGSLRLKAVTEASIKYLMMRRDWNGIIVLKIERDLPKMALSILLFVLSIFLTNHSIAKERNPTMDILLIPVGEVDRKVIEILQNELRQEFYNLPRDQGLFHKRGLTEAVHELGHTYGLGHCRNPRCVMFFSNSLVDTDRKGPEFCPDCKKQLESRK